MRGVKIGDVLREKGTPNRKFEVSECWTEHSLGGVPREKEVEGEECMM